MIYVYFVYVGVFQHSTVKCEEHYVDFGDKSILWLMMIDVF